MLYIWRFQSLDTVTATSGVYTHSSVHKPFLMQKQTHTCFNSFSLCGPLSLVLNICTEAITGSWAPKHPPPQKCQVELLQCWHERKKLPEWDEPKFWKLHCSVILKPSSWRERCSHQNTAGFSASDAFTLLDEQSTNKAWKWQFNRGIVQLMSELSHEGRWRGAGWRGTLASHAQDSNTSPAPFNRRALTVSVVSSPPECQCSERYVQMSVPQNCPKMTWWTLWQSLKLPSSPIHSYKSDS